MDWILHHWPGVLSLALIACGVWWLMPRPTRLPKFFGLILTIAGAGLLATRLHEVSDDRVQTTLFCTFSAAAILSAVLMITNRNPVYSALWFALVTLSVCGLFLLNSAPFLAAATVIVYAGAIIVTFLFVIMLAQQAGATNCDQHSYQPAAATVAAFLLLGCLMFTLQTWGRLDDGNSPVIVNGTGTAARTKFARPSESLRANPFSQPIADDLGSLRNVGRSLFTDYLYAVELAG